MSIVPRLTDVPHPGEFIRDELDARGWSQRDLACILGMPEQAVNLIASGKCGISPEMALALGNAFDVSADYFASLQRAYETIIGERLDDADENKCGDCGRPVKPTDERCPHCGAA